MLSDAEWAQVAATVMDRTGLAPDGDDLGVRWVAVRHAAGSHSHRGDAGPAGRHPAGDLERLLPGAGRLPGGRGAVRAAATAPADRTAARRPTRAETEQAARRGWAEPPRVTLRREVSHRGGRGAHGAGVLRPPRARPGCWSASGTASPARVRSPGTRSACPTTPPGTAGLVWYGGGKLAADLTLPKLRRPLGRAERGAGPFHGTGLSPAAARAVLRSMVTSGGRAGTG